MGALDKYVEGFFAGRIVAQLTRIANALEAQNYEKIEELRVRNENIKSNNSSDIEAVEVTEQDLVNEERETNQAKAKDLFNENVSGSVWEEDNIPLELQEELE